MRYSFFALISRLKYISRWALMRNSKVENVQEHSHMVAVIAHALAVIARDIFGRDIDPGAVAAAALYHDASELITGDMPTPVKYHNPEIMSAYKKVEAFAGEKLLAALPVEMRRAFDPLLTPGDGDEVTALVKAADKLAAYIKCLEEQKAGNSEFQTAAVETKRKLDALDLSEVGYFIDNFIPAFGLTLDELDFKAPRDI